MIFSAPELDARSLAVLEQIGALKRRLGSMLSEPRRWDGLLRRTAFARAIRGSNTIEGYNVTVDDAIAAVEGESPLDADDRTWAEIVGYRQAMTYVLQLARDPHFAYSNDLVRSLHYMMLSHDLSKGPGQWRPGYIYIRNDERDEILYEGPDAGAVPGLMSDLIEALNAETEHGLVVRGAMAHLNLVMIHPFRDGNGRMARALQTLVLARGGHFSPVFSSIEEYLGRNSQAYFDVLAQVGLGNWHPERDATPWLKFCLTAHFRQATTVLNRTERMRRVWDAIELEVAERSLPERTKLALADAATGHRVRNPMYRKLANITDQVASRDLRLLVDASLLVAHGEKRGRFYVGSERIMAIRKQSEGTTAPIADPFAPAEGEPRAS